MSASSFAAAISIESDQIPAPLPSYPKRSIRDDSPREADSPVDLEMYHLRTAEPSSNSPMSNGPAKRSSRSLNETAPSSPPPSHASDQIQTLWNPYKNRFRVLASCMTAFANGLNDSAPGALIASVERYTVRSDVEIK
jgi:hypothetical protein